MKRIVILVIVIIVITLIIIVVIITNQRGACRSRGGRRGVKESMQIKLE